MQSIIENLKLKSVVKGSFRVNYYGFRPFREIGLVDVIMSVNDTDNRVTIPVYRSSGTNSGKKHGDWYPILGVKLKDGEFTELSDFQNNRLNQMLDINDISEGWLMKNLFFRRPNSYHISNGLNTSYMGDKFKGYSYSRHNAFLKELCDNLKHDYENERYIRCPKLDGKTLNEICHEDEIYCNGNEYTQQTCFDLFVASIISDLVKN